MDNDFEPTIIAFFCNWCTYTAADLAGTSRLLDPKYVIKALLAGADGVLVSGCNPGDCHYINGNFKARRRIKLLKAILPSFGFEPERLALTWIAASDGVLLAETLQELVAQIKALGPSQARMQRVG